MIFERIKSEGLAQREEVKISSIFETHRNEDYVIGSIELFNLTCAEIFHGPGLNWGYGNTLHDGEVFHIGSLKITALHTPGHTDESMSYVLAESEEPVLVFTGDALFVGDVGITDFYGPVEASRLAGSLYDSIFNTILPLGDGVILCPAHGAGSVCGGNISARDESTIGIERTKNPMLQLSKEDFIEYKVTEHHERPPYFQRMEKYNLEGPPLLGRLQIPSPLTPEMFKAEMERGAVVVDARTPPAFGGAHIVCCDVLGSTKAWSARKFPMTKE